MLGTTLESAPEDPAFDQLNAAVKAAFRDLFGDRYSMREMSQEVLGNAPNRLARYMSGERQLSVEQGMRLLDHTGTSPVLFLELVLARLPKPSPAEIVRQLCLPPGAEMDPFLVELEILLATPGLLGQDRGSSAAQLEEIEEQRFVSAPAALYQAESLCRELAADIAAGCGWRSRSQHELVQALGLWATISRTLGDMPSAAQGYEAAFKHAAETGDAAGEAALRKRCSYLLMDTNYPHFALKFLNEAIEFFSLSQASEHIAGCLVDRGIIYMKIERFDLAKSDLLSALERLPSSAQTSRIAAHHWLAIRAERLGDFWEARRRLDLAVAEFGDRRDSLLGQIFWSAGRLAWQALAHAEAKSHLQNALRVLSDMGEPFEGELVLLDIAEIALQEKNRRDMDTAGKDLLGRLPKNRHSRKATEALIKVGNDFRFGKPTLGSLNDARKKLKEAGAELPPPSMKYA